jgi:hypothetical protein
MQRVRDIHRIAWHIVFQELWHFLLEIRYLIVVCHIGSRRVHVFVRHSTVAGVRHNNRIVSPAEAKKAKGEVTGRAQQLELP